jgi:hypothetical protein
VGGFWNSTLGGLVGIAAGGSIGVALATGCNWIAEIPQRRYYRAYWDAQQQRARHDEQSFRALLTAYGLQLDGNGVRRIEPRTDDEEA